MREAYRELVAKDKPGLLTDENDNPSTKIRPSAIPEELKIVSEEELVQKQRTVIPQEVTPPPYVRKKMTI